jgi:hypothetical protein
VPSHNFVTTRERRDRALHAIAAASSGAAPSPHHSTTQEHTVTKQRLTRLVLAVSGLVGVLAAGGSSVHWN